MAAIRANLIRFAMGLAVTAGAAVLLSESDVPDLTVHDKAFYADPALVNFVRPGVTLKVTSADIAADGTIRAVFQLADPKGQPLDKDGWTTPGAIALGFIAATIPKGQTQYFAYTSRQVTGTSGLKLTVTQAAADPAGGTFEKLAEGQYRYTFVTKAPSGFDRTATHSIGAYATRDLTEFNLGTQYDNSVYNFVPDGSSPVTVRDIVRTDTCNNRCHDPLAVHGGRRRKVELCILCHQPQSRDANSGNTVDFKVMIHKIHAGESLPSVIAGTPYWISNPTRSNFSDIAFPADVRNCQVCHDPNSGAKQANAWLTPSRAACGSCHDDVDFASGQGHVNQPQVNDSQCARCHIPQGDSAYDASVMNSHFSDAFAPGLPGTVFSIVRVDNGSAGKNPAVTFMVKDKAGNPIALSDMARLSLVVAGPTSDYATAVTEDARKAQGSNGQYVYTFQYAIPADAKGSYSVSIEGYRNITLLQGTVKQFTVRDAGSNVTQYFAVDGSPVAPRRTVVAVEKCNACHLSLEMHGRNRNNPEHCVQCHNPNATDKAGRPAANMPDVTINFRYMIHRIHTGVDSTAEYTIYGGSGKPTDLTGVRFPGDRRNCKKCHVNNSEQLPLPDNLLQVKNPRGLLNPMGPTTAACTGCHTEVYSASHALSMTTSLGEACAACHGKNSEFSVDKVHAR